MGGPDAPTGPAPEDPTITLHSLPGVATGDRIGPYRLIRILGEGGFGVVFMAEQTEPVRRRVALKIIKPGMDSRSVVARFEAERQALALMDHPNVARVFDGGTTEDGRPYFVMELVLGEPITDFCDRQRLTLADRLELFIRVCEAVQHAHTKGVIHRDLKPSNILVEYEQEKPVPKVIDFGVAKALNQRLSEASVFTEQGQIIGTPEYMSPEQAEMSALDIDTRSDVYSLGVLLYELLTGLRPFDLSHRAILEFARIIREEEPARPSTRVGSVGAGDDTVELARLRQADTRTLSRRLRGDLDWIVMKCLEKDRGRRYETASGLAMDLRRYLSDQPVLAGPPSAAYRFRKFARRNRGLLTAATFCLVALVGGLTVALIGLDQAIAGRNAANEAKVEADEARDEAEAVVTFLMEMVGAASPKKLGRKATVRDLLDDAAGRIRTKFQDQPRLEGRMRDVIGWTYMELDHYLEADEHVPLAVDIRRRELGADHPDTLHSMNNLAVLRKYQERFEESARIYEELVALRFKVMGEDNRGALWTMHNYGNLLQSMKRFDESEQVKVENVELRRKHLGPEDPDTLVAMTSLANLYYAYTDREEKAIPLLEEVLEIQRQDEAIGPTHVSTLNTMNSLGDCYKGVGRLDEAEQLLKAALDGRREKLSPDHRHTMVTTFNLAELYLMQERFVEAEPLCRLAYEGDLAKRGEDHPYTLESLFNYATVLLKLDRPADALPRLEQCWTGQRDNERVDDAARAATLQSLIDVNETLEHAEAASRWREVLAERLRAP